MKKLYDYYGVEMVFSQRTLRLCGELLQIQWQT